MLTFLHQFLNLFLHLDTQLASVAREFGVWIYGLLFAVVICETGCVVLPMLPGDSLLFAAGSLAALGALQIWWLFVLILIAAVAGDAINYSVGRWFGHHSTTHTYLSRWIKPSHLEKTHAFYATHGKRTIVIARFIPVVRTFAPFIAGAGGMSYAEFSTYNILGAGLWVTLLLGSGYFFGQIPLIQQNFSKVLLLIILISLLPAIVEVCSHRFSNLAERTAK